MLSKPEIDDPLSNNLRVGRGLCREGFHVHLLPLNPLAQEILSPALMELRVNFLRPEANGRFSSRPAVEASQKIQ